MNDVPTTPAEGIWARLPEWARPLDQERHGLGSRRLAESTILILIGLFLAVATVNDVVLQTHVNHRLRADLATWRTVTGHDYVNLDTEQDVKTFSTRDTVCGNVSPGAPGARAQVCLMLAGAVVSGMRSVTGGYYLPQYKADLRANRYKCFGLAAEADMCVLSSPPAGSPPSPPLPLGRP
ncbi:MAG TPA: hypothetical protein VGP18_02680 [Solirubrobacteraceae bacterium]|jgi:hypothetical protein|nr:hypothetical protein [Solirubrobacteraceae bacterium]